MYSTYSCSTDVISIPLPVLSVYLPVCISQSTSTPVDYVTPKAVKKMGGGGPGMVKYEGAKVVRGEPSRCGLIVQYLILRRN